MASISKIFKGKSKGKSKDKKKSHSSISLQSNDNGRQIGKDEEKAKDSFKQKSSVSETENSEKKEEPVTASGSSGDGHCVVGPQTQPKSSSTGNNLKHHVDRDKDVTAEAPSHQEYLPSLECPPHSNFANQPMSLGHQEKPISSQPAILEVQQAMQMVNTMSLEHPGSPIAIPSKQQLDEKFNNTSATVNPGHPGSPDEAGVHSYNCQRSGGTCTDNMPQNSVGELDVPGRASLNHGAETSSSVDDSRAQQTSTEVVSANINDQAPDDGVPSEGHCASPVAPPSSAVNQGPSDMTGPADVTSNLPHASNNQKQEPVGEEVPPNEQGSEASGLVSLTGQPTQVSETEAVTAAEKEDAVTVAEKEEAVTAAEKEEAVTAAEKEETVSAAEKEDAAIFHSQRLVTETVMKNKNLHDKLARSLDKTHRVIKGWEHLACTQVINAPLELRLRWKLKAEYSPTEKLIDILTIVHGNTELKVFYEKLTAIRRMDVVHIVKEYFSDAEISEVPISDSIASNTELIERMATKLDQKSRINKYWLHLGQAFKVSSDHLKEIEYRYNPTFALMEYIYATSKSKFTVKSFRDHMVTFKRHDVVKKLEHLMQENGGSADMKVAIPLDSDLMRAICVCLNNPNNVLKNWKHLAGALGVDREIYQDFNPGDLKSPTALLFEWVFAEKPQLKVSELCCALRDIERNDLVGTVREHVQ